MEVTGGAVKVAVTVEGTGVGTVYIEVVLVYNQCMVSGNWYSLGTNFFPSLPIEYMISISEQTDVPDVRCGLTGMHTDR